MPTRLAKALLVLSAALLLAGVADQPRLAAIGGGLLAWLLVEWVIFTVAMSGFSRWVRLERTFTGPPCLPTVWRDQALTVQLALTNRSIFHFAHVEVWDILPGHLEPVPDAAQPERWRLALGAHSRREWAYPVTAARVGVARFPGLAVQVTSLAGLFLDARFLVAPAELRIYPPVGGKQTLPSLLKSYNHFLQHGAHVFRKGGTGSELLELRDYEPGDSPRHVAWRASARREELLTRVFESEVPMRITVFLDASASMRVGSRRTHFEIATGMIGDFARLALTNRDWVGLTLISEDGEEVVRPARGRTQLLRILDALTRHGNLSPGHALGDVEGLLQAAEAYAQVRFPTLWEAPFNRSTAGLFTLPFFGNPARTTQVKRIAAIAAAHLGEGPRVLERALHDRAVLGRLLARFAESEGLRVRKGFGEEVLALAEQCRGKLDILDRSIRWAMQHARDDELFVLLVDFAGLEDALDPILESLKLARQRHHDILVMGPWLSEYFQEAGPAVESGTKILHGPFGAGADAAGPLALADRLTYTRYLRSQEAVRARFHAAGLPFAVVHAQEALPRLLSTVTRLRLNRGVMT